MNGFGQKETKFEVVAVIQAKEVHGSTGYGESLGR